MPWTRSVQRRKRSRAVGSPSRTARSPCGGAIRARRASSAVRRGGKVAAGGAAGGGGAAGRERAGGRLRRAWGGRVDGRAVGDGDVADAGRGAADLERDGEA